MLWHIELKFCIWLCFTVLQIKFECRQFASIFVGVMPLLELKLLEIQFSALSPTCFDILSWNFAHDFVLMYYRSSLSVVNLCQFLLELCPFWNLKYCKYTVFRTFLLHALTYWVEILHMTLFYCTTDQVRVSSIFVWVMPLLELRILKIYSFPHFFLTCFDLLSWKFAYAIMALFYWNKDQLRLSSICVNFLWELCPFWNFEYLKYAVYFSVTCFGILSWNFSCDFL